jgi:DeoR/GlpR family transcriptional regulator of sugar metabolism
VAFVDIDNDGCQDLFVGAFGDADFFVINDCRGFANPRLVEVPHEKGLMTQALFIQEFLPDLFSYANEINILADSSKFQKIGALQIAPLNSSMKIFTNKGLADSVRSEILRHVSEIII